jgi:hypothetical protein
MKHNHFTGAATAALLLFAGTAGATTYTGVQNIDGATADLSITTDGVIGIVNQSDITAFNVNITDAAGSIDLSDANSGLDLDGSALTATPTALQFDFDATGYNFALFELKPTYFTPFYCIATKGCYPGGSTPAIGLSTQVGESPLEQIGESGLVTVATVPQVSAVPEPSTWALMLFGIGGLGMALRRTKKIKNLRIKPALAA